MRPKFSSLALFALSLSASATWATDAQATPPEEPAPEVVASFNSLALEVPESIATDFAGNQYVSLALTGEISKIDPWGNVNTLATLPIPAPMEPCFDFVSGLGALTWTPWGLYVNVNACDEEDRGVWWVSQYTGAMEKVASLPTDSFANGIAHRFGKLYISDSFSGRVFRVPVWGGEPEIVVDEPLLEPVPNPYTPIGANGLQFFDNEMYISNSTTGQIVAFPLQWNGTVGAPRVHATLPNACDDFAFNNDGTIYCGTNPVNEVIAIYQDGTTETVLDGTDFLDGPSSITFGRLCDRFTMYVTNASFPFYPNQGNPSVISIEMDVRGYPFR